MHKREVTSSESKGYMGGPGKRMTTYIALRNKRSNKKKIKCLPLLTLLIRTSGSLSGSLIMQLIY